MTGYAESAALASGFLRPGMELVSKPIALGTLAARLRRILMNPSIRRLAARDPFPRTGKNVGRTG